MSIMNRIAVSATGGDDKKPLDEVLKSYSAMGYLNFEAWIKSRGSVLDPAKGAACYKKKIAGYGMAFSSLHMPSLAAADEAAIRKALDLARFAEELGIKTVTFNADTKQVYIESVKRFLDALTGHDLTAVIQVHEGRAVASMDDLTEVLDAVNDERLKVQHVVGSFHAMGVSWRVVCERFSTRIGLVHVKDMIGGRCVPLGKGEVDIAGLFKYMEGIGYSGYYVVEIVPEDRENTNRYFADAWRYLNGLFGE
jgi:sugar phosphate isomerase/epimerase